MGLMGPKLFFSNDNPYFILQIFTQHNFLCWDKVLRTFCTRVGSGLITEKIFFMDSLY